MIEIVSIRSYNIKLLDPRISKRVPDVSFINAYPGLIMVVFFFLVSNPLTTHASKLFKIGPHNSFFASKKEFASPLLRQLHWLPVRVRITFKCF